MIRQDLVPYIQSYMKQGYSKEVIVRYLAAYGYKVEDISDTYNAVTGSAKKGSPLPLIIGGVLVLCILAIVAYLFLMPAKSNFSFVATMPNSVESSSELFYSISLSGWDNSKSTTIVEKITSNSGSEIFRSDEQLNSKFIAQKKILLRSTITPGIYTLNLEAHNGKGVYTKSMTFQVLPSTVIPPVNTTGNVTGNRSKLCANAIRDFGELGVDCGGPCPQCVEPTTSPTPGDACDISCDDQETCTLDTCKDGQCGHDQIIPCCGNTICETGETEENCPTDCVSNNLVPDMTPLQIMERAALFAADDVEKAAKLCKTLVDVDYRDTCIDRIAKVSGKSTVCDIIEKADIQSACFMDFAMKENDFTVCDKIQNPYLHDSCQNLAQLHGA
jgi:hypothetical protein